MRSCVGNFATGTPPLELWPEFFPALQAVKETGGFLGLHEYSAPTMWFGTGVHQLEAGQDEGDEGWLTLRYRKVYRRYLQPAGLAVPLVITETGIDGGIVQRPGPVGFGWQDFQGFWEAEGLVRTTAAGFYMEQLAWYDAELGPGPLCAGRLHLRAGRPRRLALLRDQRAAQRPAAALPGGSPATITKGLEIGDWRLEIGDSVLRNS